ncbi:Krox-like protein [Cryptosporidium ryanae]|uniref:Krox-like protein n=1 Tax=Cryptosporidium ryanae TaxID=515981 RepID=UPI00351A7633|nr:Krox-like protein [Cryptosporidium ryanae]
MGNNNSLQNDGECHNNDALNKLTNLSSYSLSSYELEKIAVAAGVQNAGIRDLNTGINIDLLSKYFNGDLCKFYIGLFSFCNKDKGGRITLGSLIKIIDSFFYSNNNGIIKDVITYVLSVVDDEIVTLRVILSVIYHEMNFLLYFGSAINKKNTKFENEHEYFNSIVANLDFEFVTCKYYTQRSTENYSNLSSGDAVNEFVLEYLPLFALLLRFAIRVRLDITSHPNSIKGAFYDEKINTMRNSVSNFLEINASSSLIDVENNRKKCIYKKPEMENWIDSSSRILSIENCSVIRCQSFGDISSGEFLTLFQPWNILYASWKHGLSLQRLINSVEGYYSHVLFLVRTVDNCVFGAVCVGDWKEGNGKFCGDETCFLISLKPKLSIIDQTGKGRNFMYINSKYEFSPKGLGFGGEPEYSRLWLDSSLSTGSCMKTDLTYKSGMLYLPTSNTSKRNSCLLLGTPYSNEKDDSTLELSKFSVADIEVWGFGGPEVLKEYLEIKATSDYFKQERKVIDKSKFIKSEFDKEFLLGNTYTKGNKSGF